MLQRETLPVLEPVAPLPPPSCCHLEVWKELLRNTRFMASAEMGSSAKGNRDFEKPSAQAGAQGSGMALAFGLQMVKGEC